MKLSFPDLESAIGAAKDTGFSVGTPHRNEPIGLMHGSFHIAKWRSLNRCDRKLCHAVIHQSHPGGVTVVLQKTCPKAPAAALCEASVSASPSEVA